MEKEDLTKLTNDELLEVNKTLEDFLDFLNKESSKEENGDNNE